MAERIPNGATIQAGIGDTPTAVEQTITLKALLEAVGFTVTTQNLTVVETDADRELVLVRGSVPGPKQSTVLIKDAAKKAVR